MRTIRIENGCKVLVEDLTIERREVAEYLGRIPDAEWGEATIRAVEVGVFCLERASLSRDLDFVRQQLEQQVRAVGEAIGQLPAQVLREFLKHVGEEDGQVLKPILGAITLTETALKERLTSVQELFDGHIDPRCADTTLGMALNRFSTLLNAKHDDSIQKSFERAMGAICGDDGALAKKVAELLDDKLEPLQREVTRLGTEVLRGKAAAEALAGTLAKGAAFEHELLPTVQCWAKLNSAWIEHVGDDRKPGDIVVEVPDQLLGTASVRIVIEARDDQQARGRKQIADSVAKAMAERKAHYGLYVGKTRAAFAREIGDWSEGQCAQGPFVACTADQLVLAIRWTLLMAKYQALASAQPESDHAAIQSQVTRIRTALKRASSIKTKMNEIEKRSGSVTQTADELQREVSDCLFAIECALR